MAAYEAKELSLQQKTKKDNGSGDITMNDTDNDNESQYHSNYGLFKMAAQHLEGSSTYSHSLDIQEKYGI